MADRSSARALDRAKAAGVETAVVRWEDHQDRHQFSEAVADEVDQFGAKGVVLAGFMRILAPVFIDRFPSRILNIHPSLLPAFPGNRAVEDALEHGAKVTGVTIHIVDEKIDHGPIVAQRAVPVLEGDTVESLHARIQIEEHDLYPRIVADFVRGDLSVQGRVVTRR